MRSLDPKDLIGRTIVKVEPRPGWGHETIVSSADDILILDNGQIIQLVNPDIGAVNWYEITQEELDALPDWPT